MLNKMTIGQYYQADSVIHKLDPRVKLFITIMFIVVLFTVKNWTGYVAAGLGLLVYVKLSTVPLSFIVKGLKPVWFLLIFSAVFNLFLIGGGDVLVHWWIFTITTNSVTHAARMAIRLILLIIGCSIMTYTTTPNQLTDGLEKSLGILKKIKVPVHEMSMMMSIALRFIPILIEETDKIMKAQLARGANLEEGNILQRAKALVPIMVPLFVSAFRRASDLALAMEARCYNGGDGRTKMKPLKYDKRDFVAYGLFIAFFCLVVACRISPF